MGCHQDIEDGLGDVGDADGFLSLAHRSINARFAAKSLQEDHPTERLSQQKRDE